MIAVDNGECENAEVLYVFTANGETTAGVPERISGLEVDKVGVEERERVDDAEPQGEDFRATSMNQCYDRDGRIEDGAEEIAETPRDPKQPRIQIRSDAGSTP